MIAGIHNFDMEDRDSLKELLEPFLESDVCPQHTMNFYQLDGYLKALAGAPKLLEFDSWMSLVFADEKPAYRSKEQSTAILNTIIKLYNFNITEVLNKFCSFPCDHTYSANRIDRINIEQWARGFLQGYIVLQDCWSHFINENQTTDQLADILSETILDEIDAILAVVSTVADAEYALHNGVPLNELSASFDRLPELIISYGRIGKSLRPKIKQACSYA
ncbi:MAG: YecA family protein [Sphingobacteriales bacterium]|nr:MAG: YecA family protein [Sphingobacteriales bacterium]